MMKITRLSGNSTERTRTAINDMPAAAMLTIVVVLIHSSGDFTDHWSWHYHKRSDSHHWSLSQITT